MSNASAYSFRERPELYDFSPIVRHEAAVEICAREPKRELRWPFGYWGAANSWLVLLGPSPGKDPKRNRGLASDPWTEANFVGYGPKAREIIFDDGLKERRNRHWRLLRIAAFQAAGLSPERAASVQVQLTALMNLGFENSPIAEQGAHHHARRLMAFEQMLLPRLAEARPAVIVVLSKAAWTPFEEALEQSGRLIQRCEAIDHPQPSRVRKPMKRLLARVADDLPYHTSVILASVHPSMAFTPDVDDRAIISPLADLLAQSQLATQQPPHRGLP
ncbi:MAG: hypothetical protein JNK23_15075 [Opitutaceae bacterium]|nr:hypothetical protein [Opitutaceae bacterium]